MKRVIISSSMKSKANDTSISKVTINCGMYGFPDLPLDPPEDNSWDVLDDECDVIELPFDIDIIIDTDGTWMYVDETFSWAECKSRKDGDWYTDDDYNVYIGDKMDIVENVDELLEPLLPSEPGPYHISGTAELVYLIDGIYIQEGNYPDSDEGIGYSYIEDICTDAAEVQFDSRTSKITNFKITKQ